MAQEDANTNERGKLDFGEARTRVESLLDVGLRNFIIILRPDSANLEMLDAAKDLIHDFE